MTQPGARESMEVDILYIGAGPATLASAIHVMQQVEAWNAQAEARGRRPVEPPSILVLEKRYRLVSQIRESPGPTPLQPRQSAATLGTSRSYQRGPPWT